MEDAAYSYTWSSVVCCLSIMSVMTVSPAKAAELIMMWFGILTLVGQGTMC